MEMMFTYDEYKTIISQCNTYNDYMNVYKTLMEDVNFHKANQVKDLLTIVVNKMKIIESLIPIHYTNNNSY